jgi:hypothetical protein
LLYLVRLRDLSDVVVKEVPAQSHWVVNSLFSPVVELDRCFYNGEVLKPGRLYYEDGFFDRDKWVKKPPEFTAWAKRILAAARKTLKYDRQILAYLGPEASQMRSRGIDFKLI